MSVVPATAGAVTQVGKVSVTDGTTANAATTVYTTGATITGTVTVSTATTMSVAGDYIGATVAVTGPTIALPDATDQAVAFTLTPATATATLSVAASATTFTGSWVSGSSTADQTLGTVSFSPTIPGKYTITVTPIESKIAGTVSTSSTLTPESESVTVGGPVLVPVVGTSRVAVNAASGQTGGQVRFRFAPSDFTKSGSTVTTYYATVDNGSIVDVVSSAAVGASTYTMTPTDTNTNGLNTAGGVTMVSTIGSAGAFNTGGTVGIAPGYWEIITTSPVDATQTLTIKKLNTTTGALSTVVTGSITWASSSTAASAALSTVYIGSGATCATADASPALKLNSLTLSSTLANICITLKDSTGAALTGVPLTATISGPGLIGGAAGTATGSAGTLRAVSLTAADMITDSTAKINISADGTSGATTISVYQGTTLLATKSLSFYGRVATLEATQNYAIARAGITAATLAATPTANRLGTSDTAAAGTSVATSPAVTVVAKDSAGNVVPGVTVSAVIADTSVISSVEIAEAAGTALTIGAAGPGTHLAAVRSAVGGVSGKSTTVTFRTPNPLVAGGFITTAPVTFTLGGSKLGGTVTMALDKATYQPGERMVITYTAKDASGNKVYDGVTTGTPSASKSVDGLTGGAFVDGEFVFGAEADEFMYAPTVSGAFTLTLGTGTATDATITATATVADDAATVAAAAAADAAAEAIDAANAAPDAANLAAEAADAATVAAEEARDAADAATAAVEELASQVATLMAALKAQITTLANTVAKIAKKVKA